jgi:hypothetical protein
MSTSKGFVDFWSDAVDQGLQVLRQAQDWSLQATEAALGRRAEVPSAAVVVEWSFDTAGKVLEQQRAYALRLTELLTPRASSQAKP